MNAAATEVRGAGRLTRVLLIRHGETAWSLTGQHTGRTEVPLTSNGEQMARRLEALLHDLPFSNVLTSPRLRARQTCELAGLGDGAEVEPDLAEWNYGDFEGLRGDEIVQMHPGWDVWRDGCPGGETPAQVTERADRLIRRLLGLQGTVVLFSHGHFGRVLAARWTDQPAEVGRHLQIDPATVGILGFEAGPPRRGVIALWNAAPSWLGAALAVSHR